MFLSHPQKGAPSFRSVQGDDRYADYFQTVNAKNYSFDLPKDLTADIDVWIEMIKEESDATAEEMNYATACLQAALASFKVK